MTSAHRVLAGAGVLAIALTVAGSVASLIEIINAPAAVFRWAAAAVLIVVSIGWLTAVLHHGQHRVLGYASTVTLAAGAALAGWNAHTGRHPRTPAPAAPVTAGTTTPQRGTAVIDSPANGARVGPCMVAVRFHGRPAPGSRFVVASKHTERGYHFEADLLNERHSDVWTTSVQTGGRDLTTDRNFTISVFEYDEEQVDYLTSVVSHVEDEGTYWPSPQLPPDMPTALATITVERSAPDPTCLDD